MQSVADKSANSQPQKAGHAPYAHPTPWRVGRDKDGWWVMDDCNSPVVRTGSNDLARDNASIIVRAVNSHAGLLAACKELLDKPYWDAGINGIVARAIAAIAAAEGWSL